MDRHLLNALRPEQLQPGVNFVAVHPHREAIPVSYTHLDVYKRQHAALALRDTNTLIGTALRLLTDDPVTQKALSKMCIRDRYQGEHGEIRLTNSGAWNRHCIDWVVRRMDFPNWTAEKLYSVN